MTNTDYQMERATGPSRWPEAAPERRWMWPMAMARLIAFATIIMASVFLSIAAAGPLEDGEEAARAGNYQDALSIFLELANGGDAQAQMYVGWMVRNGHGAEREEHHRDRWLKAEPWYVLAAEQGLAEAQLAIGEVYLLGFFAPKDDAIAAKWMALAADQGNTQAQAWLGSMYMDGQGVPVNYLEGVRLLKLAAYKGDFSAQYDLGRAYEWGHGVPQDYSVAYAWYNIAAAQTSHIVDTPIPSERGRDRMLEALEGVALDRAQQLSSEYWEIYVVPFLP